MSKGTSILAALVLDFLIVTTSVSVLGTLLFILMEVLPSVFVASVVVPIWLALGIVALLGYWPYFMIARKGYTPGRALVGFPKP